MANPSWSSDNITFNTLRGYYKLGGRPKSIHREQITKKTDNGAIFKYEMYERRTIDIKFWCNASQLADHADLDSTVAGDQFPFYFSLSGAGAADSIYMRGNQDYDPQELDLKARIPSFSTDYLYEVSYHLEEEIV